MVVFVLKAAALHQHFLGHNIKPLDTVYLGPDIAMIIYLNLEDTKYTVSSPSNTVEAICNDLLDNLIVGIVRGKILGLELYVIVRSN